MKTWQGILLGTFLGLAASAAILLIVAPPRGEAVILPPVPTPGLIIVHISGAVKNPGLVTLPRQSRVQNAVEAAGGFSEDADQAEINLAAKINDGDKISIPSKFTRETREAAGLLSPTISEPKKASSPSSTPTPHYPLNINTATQTELETLPNIGPGKASAILTFRNEHGLFKRIEDIQDVPGIGAATFEKLKDLITVGP